MKSWPTKPPLKYPRSPFCLLGKGEWGSGGLVGREKEQGGTTRWINIFNRGRDQAFIEWGQREAFSHTYRVWEKTEMSVSWICFHCHGKTAMGRVITWLLTCSFIFSFLTNVGGTWTCAQNPKYIHQGMSVQYLIKCIFDTTSNCYIFRKKYRVILTQEAAVAKKDFNLD